jgi:hypothetical protein
MLVGQTVSPEPNKKDRAKPCRSCQACCVVVGQLMNFRLPNGGLAVRQRSESNTQEFGCLGIFLC